MSRHRISRSIAMFLALLLHVVGIWMLLVRDPLVIKPVAGGNEGAITYIAPLADAAAPKKTPAPITLQPPKPPSPKKPPVRPVRKNKPVSKPPTALAHVTPPRKPTPPTPDSQTADTTATERLTPAPNVAPQADAAKAAPTEDFAAHIAARQQARAEAQAQDPSLAQAPAETDSQRANRIARENIAFQQHGRNAEQDQTGGVFQLRELRLHNAAFMFRGWNTNFRRNWNQVVEVEQGTEVDIEVAVVKRMIALIRSQKQGEFIWESHRLGRQITLNADPAYEKELQAFLLKEFFPTYVRTSGR